MVLKVFSAKKLELYAAAQNFFVPLRPIKKTFNSS